MLVRYPYPRFTPQWLPTPASVQKPLHDDSVGILGGGASRAGSIAVRLAAEKVPIDAPDRRTAVWKMPARNLFRRLVEKTDHRVLQMDYVNPPECDPKVDPAKAAWKRADISPRVTAQFIELDIVG